MTATALTMRRGEHKKWLMTITESSVAVDITDADVHFAARATYPAGNIVDDTDAVLYMTNAAGITLTDPTNGQFELEIVHADTASLDIVTAAGVAYMYSVEYVPDNETEPIYVDSGTITILPDIVRTV
jgi:hypothetical protein